MLHHAARKGSLESLRLILKHYPDVIRRVDVRSNTALHYAAAKSHSPSDSHS